jgi:hypothetical protein
VPFILVIDESLIVLGSLNLQISSANDTRLIYPDIKLDNFLIGHLGTKGANVECIGVLHVPLVLKIVQ